MRGNFAAVALIVAGVIALAVNLGWIEIDFAGLLRTWWPLALIILGLGMFLAPDNDQRQRGIKR